ncbi:MAG TPA: methylated-DNA--[protein]-cysteine S-methyltransferase [Actinomycetota bacterium]|nr:methylated-DNA--[protein]-cysteine S-methyltransferase [Actinomycetota bacterium]
MTVTSWTTFPSPIGDIVVGGDETGIAMLGRYATPPEGTRVEVDDIAVFAEAKRQLDAYFEGSLFDFDLPLAPAGTPFQHKVWSALRTIPYGRTATYGQIAAQVGAPTAARAVGAANGRNPIAIVVPCHRVIGANGTLTGYAGGLDMKRQLLSHEGKFAKVPSA